MCPRLPVGGMLGLAAQLQWLGLGVCRPALWAELVVAPGPLHGCVLAWGPGACGGEALGCVAQSSLAGPLTGSRVRALTRHRQLNGLDQACTAAAARLGS